MPRPARLSWSQFEKVAFRVEISLHIPLATACLARNWGWFSVLVCANHDATRP